MLKYICKILGYLRGILIFRTKKNISCHSLKLFVDKGAKAEVSSNSIIFLDGSLNISRFSRISVRSLGQLEIGGGFFCNEGCQIICRKLIKIGSNVQLGHNVIILDHDHDFRTNGGIADGLFTEDAVVIGDNVWIGANTVILKGTHIGDGCVVGAGSVIKGNYDSNKIIVQKRNEKIIDIDRGR